MQYKKTAIITVSVFLTIMTAIFYFTTLNKFNFMKSYLMRFFPATVQAIIIAITASNK